MRSVSIHRARELKPQTRSAVEAELGRELRDDEDVSIMAFSNHEAPAGEAQRAAKAKLAEYFSRVDARENAPSEADVDAAVAEAMKDLRPGYRERE
jgi:hypothetical protein